MINPLALLLAQAETPPADDTAPVPEDSVGRAIEDITATSKDVLSGDTSAMWDLV
jgi:hypothetical protein